MAITGVKRKPEYTEDEQVVKKVKLAEAPGQSTKGDEGMVSNAKDKESEDDNSEGDEGVEKGGGGEDLKGKGETVEDAKMSEDGEEGNEDDKDDDENDKGEPIKPTHRIRKLAPPRPYPTVPTSVSATGPRSAHTEGKNYICITRKTPLGGYLRRCKDVVVKDGCVPNNSLVILLVNRILFFAGSKHCILTRWELQSPDYYSYRSRFPRCFPILRKRFILRS